MSKIPFNSKSKTNEPIDLSGTVYDINKSMVKQTGKRMSRQAVTERIQDLLPQYLKRKIENKHKYFMLLCNEARDYTVFNLLDTNNIDTIYQIFQECLENRGYIYDIIETEDKVALEIWIQSHADSQIYCYYFFPNDLAVIEIPETKEE